MWRKRKERLVNGWACWDVLLDGARGKKTRSAIICELDLSGEKDSRDGDWAIGRRRVIERPEAGKQPKGYE